MKFHKSVLPNGDLKITADNEGRAYLKEQLKETSVVDFWPEFVAEFIAFYYPWLRYALPEELGALTSSPILLETASCGCPLAKSRVWWFPEYQVENEFDTLKRTGRLVMSLAPED
jgi:hypothetical protein